MTWNLIGQEKTAEQLRQTAAAGRPNHAYLFTGPAHLGKTTLARQLAAALICDKHEPCGECPQCHLLQSGNHPDYLELPTEDSLTIKHVRDLKSTLTLKPHSASFRVAVIPDAERFGIPAQNALLKLLEEPPAQTVVILTAASPSALLPTTVSRCQHIDFHLPPIELLRRLLPKKPDAEDAIRASGRRPGLALRLLEEPERLEAQKEWDRWLTDLVAADVPTRLSEAKRLADHPDLPEILDHWQQLFREALHGETRDQPLSPAAADLAKHFSAPQLLERSRALFAARQRLGYNPNVLLLLEDTLLTLGV